MDPLSPSAHVSSVDVVPLPWPSHADVDRPWFWEGRGGESSSQARPAHHRPPPVPMSHHCRSDRCGGERPYPMHAPRHRRSCRAWGERWLFNDVDTVWFSATRRTHSATTIGGSGIAWAREQCVGFVCLPFHSYCPASSQPSGVAVGVMAVGRLSLYATLVP